MEETGRMDWFTYFKDFFSRHTDRLEALFDAAGCREGWLQGEFFIDGQELQIKTNATPKKFDLLCSNPPMIAEIKICGGNYASKMRGYIQEDADKLARASRNYERFLLLVVDNRHPDTELGCWLTTCDFEHVRKDELKLSDTLIIRLWQIIRRP